MSDENVLSFHSYCVTIVTVVGFSRTHQLFSNSWYPQIQEVLSNSSMLHNLDLCHSSRVEKYVGNFSYHMSISTNIFQCEKLTCDNFVTRNILKLRWVHHTQLECFLGQSVHQWYNYDFAGQVPLHPLLPPPSFPFPNTHPKVITYVGNFHFYKCPAVLHRRRKQI